MKITFGRDRIADPRDRDYLFTKKRTQVKKRIWQSWRWHGNQEDTPQCCGYGAAHLLDASPHRQFLDPTGIYLNAQFWDEWEGTDYDGTSVRGVAKFLQSIGYFDSYLWAFNGGLATNHVLNKGPVLIGVDWYEGMMDTDSNGFVHAEGEIVGGHCVCVTAACTLRGEEWIKFKQSWGKDWGLGGYGYMTSKLFNQLIEQDGEACAPHEVKPSPSN